MRKTYRSHSILCIEVGCRRVTFSGSRNTYSTEDESEIAELDRLVELDYIELDEVDSMDNVCQTSSEEVPNGIVKKSYVGDVFSEFAFVTKISEAKAVLIGEPYNVSVDDMKNKSAILSIADKLKVSFPNLK